MLVLGIDDAGRGPAIGPMVLAGVLIDKKLEPEFLDLGIKDSKKVLPKKREQLAKIIKEKAIATYEIIVSVDEIDGKKGDGLNLNQREALASSMIINKLNPKKQPLNILIDCPSTNTKAWKEYLEQFLIGKSNLTIQCEHKADFHYVTVAAASILAKVRRDAEIKKLKEKFGVNFGSGYASDPITRKFIYENYEKFKDKGLFRESWGTIKKHKVYKKQKKLF
jgi:ribonuclease HII